MRTVLNDISFEYIFDSKQKAIEEFHNLLEIYKGLLHKRVRRVQEVYGNRIDSCKEIAPNYKIIQLVQEFRDREDRTMLLGLLSNSRYFEVDRERQFMINNKKSMSGAFAHGDGILVSLCSDDSLKNTFVIGEYNGEKVKIDNMSQTEHLVYFSLKLGLFFYEPNPKHSRCTYIRAGGVEVGAMDLTDDIAQKVLDEAIELDNRLFGCYNDEIYEFRKTENNTYHGYKNEKIEKDLKNKILQRF